MEWIRKLIWHMVVQLPKRFVLYLQKVGKINKSLFLQFSQNDVSELMYLYLIYFIII